MFVGGDLINVLFFCLIQKRLTPSPIIFPICHYGDKEVLKSRNVITQCVFDIPDELDDFHKEINGRFDFATFYRDRSDFIVYRNRHDSSGCVYYFGHFPKGDDARRAQEVFDRNPADFMDFVKCPLEIIWPNNDTCSFVLVNTSAKGMAYKII